MLRMPWALRIEYNAEQCTRNMPIYMTDLFSEDNRHGHELDIWTLRNTSMRLPGLNIA